MPGLDNFQYELEVKDGNASFKFVDPQDASNTADVTLAQKDFPDGINDATDRSVADLAFSQVAQKLNDSRDARVAKEEADAAKAKVDEDKRSRDAAQDFFDNSQDVTVAPAKVDKDGTNVYNTAEASAPAAADDAPSDNAASDKKK
jgi:hypothetical protein